MWNLFLFKDFYTNFNVYKLNKKVKCLLVKNKEVKKCLFQVSDFKINYLKTFHDFTL